MSGIISNIDKLDLETGEVQVTHTQDIEHLLKRAAQERAQGSKAGNEGLLAVKMESVPLIYAEMAKVKYGIDIERNDEHFDWFIKRHPECVVTKRDTGRDFNIIVKG